MQASCPPLDGLRDRVILVTGAGKGLGAAFARALAAAGARVVVNNRIRDGGADDASAVAAAIRDDGGEAIAEHSDITAPGAGTAMVNAARAAFGGLDSVVCNAGITGPARRFGAGAMEALRTVMETNFFANAALLEAAQPLLEESGSGRVVLISSSAGLYGLRGRGQYAASKGALVAFGLSLAEEWRGRIGVNILCPYAATRMTGVDPGSEVGQLVTPESVAPAAVWLSSAAQERTGEIWLGGGGYLRRVRIVETVGGRAGTLPDEIDDFAATQGRLDGARGFPDAETAFDDFFAMLQDRASQAERDR